MFFLLKLAFGLTKNYPRIPAMSISVYDISCNLRSCDACMALKISKNIYVLRGFPRSSHQRRPLPGVPFLFQLHDPRLDGALDVLGW